MQQNSITGLSTPENPQDAATKNYVDNNVGSGGGDTGGGQANSAPALAWSEAEPKRDRYSFNDNSDTAEIRCDFGEVLMDVTCFSDARSGGSDAEGDHIEKCDSRTRNSASVSASNDGFADPVGVSGTCVPTRGGGQRQVFSDQNSSSTFEVPQGASTVNYRLYGGSGGDADIDASQYRGGDQLIDEDIREKGGDGGFVEGAIPVDGGETLEVYVGQNGAGRGGDWSDERSRGGCVPFDGVTCGGYGRAGYKTDSSSGDIILNFGGTGGGAPTILADSDGIVTAAGGGGGVGIGGGGGAGGGSKESVFGGTSPEDGDNTPKNLGGNYGENGGTFARQDVSVESTGATGQNPKVELYAVG